MGHRQESLIRAQSDSALEGTSDVRSNLRALMGDEWPRNLVFMFRRDALSPAKLYPKKMWRHPGAMMRPSQAPSYCNRKRKKCDTEAKKSTQANIETPRAFMHQKKKPWYKESQQDAPHSSIKSRGKSVRGMAENLSKTQENEHLRILGPVPSSPPYLIL